MKTQHTPGPWVLAMMPDEIDLRGNNGNKLIASFPHLSKEIGVAYCPSEEDAANLRLISAAPELLAALKGTEKALARALSFLPADTEAHFAGEWLIEACDVIAKATEERV